MSSILSPLTTNGPEVMSTTEQRPYDVSILQEKRLFDPLDPLINGLLASFSVVIIGELGDKTFLITVIMSMRNSRLLVFFSSALAMFVMTILSVVVGAAVTVIPSTFIDIASIILFAFFGLKLLKEAYEMEGNGIEDEYKELEKTADSKGENTSKLTPEDTADKDTSPSLYKRLRDKLAHPIAQGGLILEIFSMIFVAEWGDRSQISTIILAAREDVVGVFVGSLLGHLVCTALAVIGGRFVADFISVKAMTTIGGCLFIFFAALAIINGINNQI